MSQLDRTKELLTTLRAAFGIIIAIILTVTAGLIKMYYNGHTDVLFYLGASFDIIFVLSLLIILKYIVKSIKEIGEL